ncbi:tetratricopeptide repeat protein [Fodinibius saliphilus]|uniref:tetratricopeptide repeat protein n=1 Tax=Fodinibius saliphilus TaxID=1920650 RepID=UPI0011090D03|nr:tetratricopeptide repeat protein [Fodinibius saliphilus]
MNNELAPVAPQGNSGMEWAEVVLFLSDMSYLDNRKLSQWAEQFAHVTVAGKAERPEEITDGIDWYRYEEESVRSEVWNTILDKVRKNWVLFVEDDETVRLSSFPDKHSLSDRTWTPTLIRQEKEDRSRQFYQMRLINAAANNGSNIFSGRNLPDSTQYIRGHDIELSNHPIIIERESNPISHIDIDEELSVKEYSPKLYLVQGERYFNEKKYVRAAAQYRQLLKMEKLLPYDRLAAVNGLASCLTEQHKWTNAMTLAEESLKAESLQSLPYLIKYRIFELKKEWGKAHETLSQYYRRFSLYSRANFDRNIDEEKTLVSLANVALKSGDRKAAAGYFENLFSFKRGDIDRSLLKKVLVMSVELDDYERSVYLFERMFGDKLPDKLDAQGREELEEIMTLFMSRKWHEYVSQVYTKLHNAYPEDSTYKRRLIVTLTKTNRLDKAKSMVANIV